MRNGLWLSLLLSFALAGQCKVFGQISNGPGTGSGGSGGGNVTMPGDPTPGSSSTMPIGPMPGLPGKFVPPQVVTLRANDVIVFGGDSVTDIGGFPGGWIDNFNRQVQNSFPGQNINVIASGVGGDTAAKLDSRLETTVLNHNPTIVVIFIGINDVVGAPLNLDGSRDLSGYMSTIQDIVNKCMGHRGVRTVILMTPMAYGDKFDGEGKFDSAIDAMAQDLRNFASSNMSNGVALSDLRTVIIQGEPIFNPQDKGFGVFMNQSLVHPTALGGQILTGTEMMSFGI